MGNIIKCCRYCVAPKRYPGCHGTCPEYLKERAEYDRLKAIDDKKRQTSIQLYDHRITALRKMLRKKRVN